MMDYKKENNKQTRDWHTKPGRWRKVACYIEIPEKDFLPNCLIALAI
jgi:hypothetical protein